MYLHVEILRMWEWKPNWSNVVKALALKQQNIRFSPALGLKPAEWLWVMSTSSSPLGEGKGKLLLNIFIIANKIAGPFPWGY